MVSPPFDQGMIWSTCSSSFGYRAGERPQILHLKLSRLKTLNLILKLTSLVVNLILFLFRLTFFLEVSKTILRALIPALFSRYFLKTSIVSHHEPKRDW